MSFRWSWNDSVHNPPLGHLEILFFWLLDFSFFRYPIFHPQISPVIWFCGGLLTIQYLLPRIDLSENLHILSLVHIVLFLPHILEVINVFHEITLNHVWFTARAEQTTFEKCCLFSSWSTLRVARAETRLTVYGLPLVLHTREVLSDAPLPPALSSDNWQKLHCSFNNFLCFKLNKSEQIEDIIKIIRFYKVWA